MHASLLLSQASLQSGNDILLCDKQGAWGKNVWNHWHTQWSQPCRVALCHLSVSCMCHQMSVIVDYYVYFVVCLFVSTVWVCHWHGRLLPDPHLRLASSSADRPEWLTFRMEISVEWCPCWRTVERSCCLSCTMLRGVLRVWPFVKSSVGRPGTWTVKWVHVTCILMMLLSYKTPFFHLPGEPICL